MHTGNTVRSAVGAVLAGLAWGASSLAAPAVVPLKANDVIVFAGDSLTEHGQWPGGFVRLIEQAITTARPDLNIQIFGAGKGWDKIRGLRERFGHDVLDLKPTVVVIEIGINDLCEPGAESETAQKIWRLGLEDLIWRIQGVGARPVLTTLTVAGERQHGSNQYDALLDRYSDIIRDVGTRKDCQVVELQKVFVGYLATNNPEQKYDSILTVDGAHMNDRGNQLFAETVLKAFGIPVKSSVPSPPPAAPASAPPSDPAPKATAPEPVS